MKKRKDWFLLIKIHPKETKNKSKKIYEQYAKKYNVKNYLLLDSTDETTYDCISISDTVILKHTTVGMESILMNKPIINFELKKSYPLDQYTELKSNLIIRKKQDLTGFLDKIVTKTYKIEFGKEREKYIEKHFDNFGNATTKFITYMNKLLK